MTVSRFPAQSHQQRNPETPGNRPETSHRDVTPIRLAPPRERGHRKRTNRKQNKRNKGRKPNPPSTEIRPEPPIRDAVNESKQIVPLTTTTTTTSRLSESPKRQTDTPKPQTNTPKQLPDTPETTAPNNHRWSPISIDNGKLPQLLRIAKIVIMMSRVDEFWRHYFKVWRLIKIHNVTVRSIMTTTMIIDLLRSRTKNRNAKMGKNSFLSKSKFFYFEKFIAMSWQRNVVQIEHLSPYLWRGHWRHVQQTWQELHVLLDDGLLDLVFRLLSLDRRDFSRRLETVQVSDSRKGVVFSRKGVVFAYLLRRQRCKCNEPHQRVRGGDALTL